MDIECALECLFEGGECPPGACPYKKVEVEL